MADVLAMAARGLPPSGLGIYLRDRASLVERVGADWGAVLAERGDAEAQVRSLGGAWLYSMPNQWRPETWRAGLEQILSLRERIQSHGGTVHGIIADPEAGWSGQSTEARRLAQALSALTTDIRVGITSYPLWGQRRTVVEHADGCWFSPQIYGRSARGAGTFAQWMAAWSSLAGAQRVIPSIAAWPATPQHASAAGYREYLSELPAAAGAIAWPFAGPIRDIYADALREYEPGGSAVGTYALALRNLLARPAAVAVAGALVLLVMVAYVGAGKVS